MIKAYKIVSKELRSVFLNEKKHGQVQYKINKKARPHLFNGPLTAFDNLETLERFLFSHLPLCEIDQTKVFECNVKLSKVQKLWHYSIDGQKYESNINPKGTLYCITIELTNEITEKVMMNKYMNLEFRYR